MSRSEQQPSLGLLMFIAYRSLETRAMTAVGDAGFVDLTLAQARILQRVGPDGTRLTALAEQAQVTKQTAGFLVDQLERSGYVERRPDPTDARARLVCVAARGARAAAVANRALADVEAEWARHLGPADLARLRRTLSRLREITDPYDG